MRAQGFLPRSPIEFPEHSLLQCRGLIDKHGVVGHIVPRYLRNPVVLKSSVGNLFGFCLH